MSALERDLPLWMDLPPHSNRTTSLDAAVEVRPHCGRMEAEVLAVIRVAGSFGATDWEIEQKTGYRHQTASARRRGLVLRGLIREAGKYRITESGRRAIVWIIAP
jgi:hypothetical protein